MFSSTTIIAPGLLGASLGAAIHQRSLSHHIRVWARRPETRVECEQLEWCHAAPSELRESVTDADLVVICTPVSFIADIVEQIAPTLKAGALVTDVGSTKSLVCRKSQAAVRPDTHFVGSHPMAGSEKTGLAHARPDLFSGSACFVTPLPDTDAQQTERLCRFWRQLDMEVVTMSPEMHDEIVAHISHLPHIIASILSAYLAGSDDQWAHFAGAGLRDTTRVASGNPELWRAIIEENRDEILRSMQSFEDEFQSFRRDLENSDYLSVLARLKQGKKYRDRL